MLEPTPFPLAACCHLRQFESKWGELDKPGGSICSAIYLPNQPKRVAVHFLAQCLELIRSWPGLISA